MPVESRQIVNPLEPLVGYQLRRISAAAMGTLGRALSGLGINATEGSVLVLIGANPGITQSEIGRVLAIKRANMTPIAAALERRGLVERRPVNGRSHGLALSEAGGATAEEIGDAMLRHDADLLRNLPRTARDHLAEALAHLQRELAPDDPARS